MWHMLYDTVLPDTKHEQYSLYSPDAKHRRPLASTHCAYPWKVGQAELTWVRNTTFKPLQIEVRAPHTSLWCWHSTCRHLTASIRTNGTTSSLSLWLIYRTRPCFSCHHATMNSSIFVLIQTYYFHEIRRQYLTQLGTI